MNGVSETNERGTGQMNGAAEVRRDLCATNLDHFDYLCKQIIVIETDVTTVTGKLRRIATRRHSDLISFFGKRYSAFMQSFDPNVGNPNLSKRPDVSLERIIVEETARLECRLDGPYAEALRGQFLVLQEDRQRGVNALKFLRDTYGAATATDVVTLLAQARIPEAVVSEWIKHDIARLKEYPYGKGEVAYLGQILPIPNIWELLLESYPTQSSMIRYYTGDIDIIISRATAKFPSLIDCLNSQAHDVASNLQERLREMQIEENDRTGWRSE